MYTDPISDLLTRIRNAEQASKGFTTVPYSKLKFEIAKKLEQMGFVEKVQESGEGKERQIVIDLADRDHPLHLTRVSKPGQRIYKKASELETVKSGLGMEIISTSKGILSNGEAYTQKLGGEVICRVY